MRIPRFSLMRTPPYGWQFCVYTDPRRNPIFLISRWMGYWLIAIGAKYWSNNPELRRKP